MSQRPPTLTPERSRRRPPRSSLALAALFVLSACAVDAGDEHAHQGPATPRVASPDGVALQVRDGFYDAGTHVINLRDHSDVATLQITVQPGVDLPWLTYPGPVLITIVEGDLVYIMTRDCAEREYSAGEVLLDAGGDNVYAAYNPSSTNTAVVTATFLATPDDVGLLRRDRQWPRPGCPRLSP